LTVRLAKGVSTKLNNVQILGFSASMRRLYVRVNYVTSDIRRAYFYSRVTAQMIQID